MEKHPGQTFRIEASELTSVLNTNPYCTDEFMQRALYPKINAGSMDMQWGTVYEQACQYEYHRVELPHGDPASD